MFIVWGRRIARRHLGWVADFCPICRQPTCMKALSVRSVPHIYFIQVAPSTAVASEHACGQCFSLFSSNPSMGYAYAPRQAADPALLAVQTNPGLFDRCADRFALESRVAAGTLAPHERETLIAEPIVALEYWSQVIAASGRIPTGAGFAIAAALFLGMGSLILWAEHEWVPALITSALTLVFTYLAVSGCRKGTRGARMLTRRLARCLAPLNPAPDEMALAIDRLRRRGLTIARQLRPDVLLDAIRAESDRVALAAPNAHLRAA